MILEPMFWSRLEQAGLILDVGSCSLFLRGRLVLDRVIVRRGLHHLTKSKLC